MATTAIFAHKGGTAKTVTAVNLAAGLAEKGLKTLLIDMDSQANATQYLGCESKHHIGDVLMDRISLPDAVCPTHWENLELLPSSHLFAEDANRLRIDDMGAPQNYLASALFPIADQWDQVIIDCPPTIDIVTANALRAAQYVVVPFVPDDFALTGIEQTWGAIQRSRRGRIGGDQLNLLAILVANVGPGRKIVSHNIEQLKQANLPIFQTMIPRTTKVVESLTEHIPVIHYAPYASASMFYRDLVDEFCTRLEEVSR